MGKGQFKHWIGHLGLIVGGIAVGVIVGEIGMRIADIPPQPKPVASNVASEPPPPNFFVPDEELGWVLQPKTAGWWRLEGNAYVEINSAGLRDREYPKAKPLNTYRIAILGDSFAEALQVPADDAFWAVMERQLQNCPGLKGRNLEVINFGVTNYGTAQQLLTLRKKVWDYSPDLVLLAMFTGNDIADNSRLLDNRNRPYFVYKNGQLVEDVSFRNPDKTLPPYNLSRVDLLPNWFVANSRILQLAKKVELETKNYQLEQKRQSTYNKLYTEPADKSWKQAWQVTEGLISLMRDEVVARNAEFLTVTLSNEVQVHPDKAFRQGFKQQNNIQGNLFYPDQRIKALGDREGFPVVNLAQPMQAYAQEKDVCLHGFDNAIKCGGHWNAEGHRIAGELVAPKVCEILDRPQTVKQ